MPAAMDVKCGSRFVTLQRFASYALAPLILATAGASNAHAQSLDPRFEVLSGRVTTAEKHPLAGAVVIATMAPDRTVFGDTVKATGDYRITVARGTGDYLLYVSAPGYVAVRKRVQRIGNDSVLTFDAQLTVPVVAQLAAVKVAARRATTERAVGGAREATASEQMSEANNGALSIDQLGDLNAIAATVPGATASTGGYSVLGLGSAQNTATINGLSFNSASLPRDMRTSTRVTTSTYDPSRGWFSGSNVNVELDGGGLFSSARAHATLDAPALQITTPLSNAAGQRFMNVLASAGADGPLTWQNKTFYNVGAQVARRTSDIVSLSSSSDALLQQVGVSPDSSARLNAAMQLAGVPMRAQSVPLARVTENASFAVRLERNPVDMKTFRQVPTAYGVFLFGQGSRDRATGINSFSTDSRAGETMLMSGGVQGVLSHFFSKDYLNETRTSFSINNRHDSSLLTAPEGRVFVQSAVTNTNDGAATLAFGGNSQGNRTLRQYTWETTNNTRFYAQAREAHAVKIASDVRFDGFQNDIESNKLGTFTYASLADVSTNTPSSYSRTLMSPVRNGGEWNAFAAVSDNWRINPSFQLLYGARVEGNAFTSRAAFNEEVANTFGARTDYAPNTVHVSPRVGFSWLLAKKSMDYKSGPSGDYTVPTPKYLRGGIGEFRNMISPSLLSDPRALTGLTNGVANLTCIGAATPASDWQAYQTNPSTIPSQCVGSAANGFADEAPAVRLIAKGYQPPTSWRANLVYSTRTPIVDWSAEVTSSLNLHQPSTVDLNFAGVQQFVLSDEGRPVFVDPSSIVASSGIVSPVSARITPAFGRVVATQSDLRSVSNQLTVMVRPMADRMRGWFVSEWYTLANNRAESRGFDKAAFASPGERAWSRGDLDVRHQFLTQMGYGRHGISVSGLLRVQSGTPFTPLVAGDVNGDGLANDRAFVANPATTADATVASGMRALLASNRNAANCLTSQLGVAAGRNSCANPWSATLNAEVSFKPQSLRNHRISSISVNFTNPLAGADQLLHGSSGIHGWGNATYVDPNLYTVRGFDANDKRFLYAVNPRFGSAQSTNALLRTPFRMTVDIAMDLGQPVARQQLNKWLRPGRSANSGQKLNKDELKKRYENNVADPFKIVLLDSDSLLLNRAQIEALQAAQQPYRARMDTLWNTLAEALAALPDKFNDAEALRMQEAAIDEAWEVTRVAVHEKIALVLSPLQMRLEQGWVAALYLAQRRASYRLYRPQ
jgi:hypothetical protein